MKSGALVLLTKVTAVMVVSLSASICFSETLCSRDEAVLFSCTLKENHKTVSMCASRNASKQSGYLQYRYGSPGAVELIYPSGKENTQSQFAYDAYKRLDFDAYVVGFKIGRYRYTLTDSTEQGGGADATLDYLTVASGEGKPDVSLTCIPSADTAAGLSNVMNMVPCDKQHIFGNGGCD